MKSVRTNCIATHINSSTGEFMSYKLTFPIPADLVHRFKPEEIYRSSNNVNYFIVESKDFAAINRIKTNLQVIVNGHKIQKLQDKHLFLTKKLSLL